VPAYTKGIDSLEDLKGKASKFGGKITGIESSAGMTSLLKSKALGEYGLDKEHKAVDGSTPAMPAELKRAYAKKQPIAVVLWSPHSAYSEYRVTKLADDENRSARATRSGRSPARSSRASIRNAPSGSRTSRPGRPDPTGVSTSPWSPGGTGGTMGDRSILELGGSKTVLIEGER